LIIGLLLPLAVISRSADHMNGDLLSESTGKPEGLPTFKLRLTAPFVPVEITPRPAAFSAGLSHSTNYVL